MTARSPRAALLLAAAVPLAAATAAAVLRTNHLNLYADLHCIEITARPRPGCPRCHGEGGWWTGGAFPEIEACGCWSDRRKIRIRLLRVSAWDEPPF
ncbi:hypothetical protein EYS09_15000 [Streptomyces kasugaensis]|uniref:Uncharacterized protein n=1 Tax=Streptomyces kasugaensis TaxID=1946 RepID=A0A4Q9HUR2_STRKA|nr:hypothetical protein [Streptomyces kasugaensis]TBO58887.1 hypothetical protein EYS09_15000 [Streptomyces kasugaensis]